MGQYWLGKTKPKQAFKSTWNAFKKLPQNLKQIVFNWIFYWLTSVTRGYGLIFSLFDVASAWEVPFGIPQWILQELTSVLLYVPFIFADSWFGGCTWWLQNIGEIKFWQFIIWWIIFWPRVWSYRILFIVWRIMITINSPSRTALILMHCPYKSWSI